MPGRATPSVPPISWTGRPPEGPLAGALASAGIRVAPGGVVEVVCTPRAEVPGRPPAGPWIWLAPERPSAAAIRGAAAAGALDVIDASSGPAVIAARLRARLAEHEVPLETPAAPPELVAQSPAGQRLLRELAHAARTSMPVLLTGETGTGKEVSARLIHQWSARGARRFVPVNCAAIPNDMLEAELFGYARGAFSGAVQGYDGQLAAAEGGTVLLDEVDDTPLSFQVKLLRVLEDRVVSRLGENQWKKVDFRILAGSNRDLRDLIARGLFGADLFERLAIVAIRLPPLRERKEDLPALCEHLFARYYKEEPSARGRHHVTAITPEALSVLDAYPWPGNIRELRNVLFGALVRKRAGRELLVSDLPRRLMRPPEAVRSSTGRVVDTEAIGAEIDAGRFNLRATLEEVERTALTRALVTTGGNAAAAASALGEVGRGTARDPGATVRAMMKRLGVEPPGSQRRGAAGRALRR